MNTMLYVHQIVAELRESVGKPERFGPECSAMRRSLCLPLLLCCALAPPLPVSPQAASTADAAGQPPTSQECPSEATPGPATGIAANDDAQLTRSRPRCTNPPAPESPCSRHCCCCSKPPSTGRFCAVRRRLEFLSPSTPPPRPAASTGCHSTPPWPNRLQVWQLSPGSSSDSLERHLTALMDDPGSPLDLASAHELNGPSNSMLTASSSSSSSMPHVHLQGEASTVALQSNPTRGLSA